MRVQQVSSATTKPVFSKATFCEADFLVESDDDYRGEATSNDESSRRLRLDAFEARDTREEPKLIGSSKMLVPRLGREKISRMLTFIREHSAPADCLVGNISIEIHFPAAELIVLARSAKLPEPQMTLRLTCAIHVDGATTMLSTTKEADATSKIASWDERLTLEMQRDWLRSGRLCIGLEEARHIIVASVPLKHLAPFMSYNLEIESEDGAAVLVTVTLRDLDSPFATKFTLSALKMAFQVAHPDKLIAVFQRIEPTAAIGDSTPLKKICHSIPLTAEDDAWKACIGDSDRRRQQVTLAVLAADDGIFSWEEDKIIYLDDMGSSANDLPSLVFIEFYAADGFVCNTQTDALFESIGYAVLQLPTRSCRSNANIYLRKKSTGKSINSDFSEIVGNGCITVAVETNPAAAPPKSFRHDMAGDLRPLWQPGSDGEAYPERLATQTRWESLDPVRYFKSYHPNLPRATP